MLLRLPVMEDEDNNLNTFERPPSGDLSAYDSGYEPSPSSISGQQTFTYTTDAMIQLREPPSLAEFFNYDDDDSVGETDTDDETASRPFRPSSIYRPRSLSDSLLTRRPVGETQNNLLAMRFLPNWSQPPDTLAVNIYRSFRGVPRIDVITFLLTLPSCTRNVATQTIECCRECQTTNHRCAHASNVPVGSPMDRPQRTVLSRARSISERGDPLPDLLTPVVRSRSASEPQDPYRTFARQMTGLMEDFESTIRARRRRSSAFMMLRTLLPSRRNQT